MTLQLSELRKVVRLFAYLGSEAIGNPKCKSFCFVANECAPHLITTSSLLEAGERLSLP